MLFTKTGSPGTPNPGLRKAQMTLLERLPHPVFWAPFVLFGEERFKSDGRKGRCYSRGEGAPVTRMSDHGRKKMLSLFLLAYCMAVSIGVQRVRTSTYVPTGWIAPGATRTKWLCANLGRQGQGGGAHPSPAHRFRIPRGAVDSRTISATWPLRGKLQLLKKHRRYPCGVSFHRASGGGEDSRALPRDVLFRLE